MLWIAPLSALIIGYGLGSIPFGLILTRFGGAGDLRAIGSGNIGATNVLRTGRKGLAAATLFLDGAKGAAAVLIAEAIQPGLGPVAGLAAFFGHCYPLIFAGVWLAALALFRYSSVGGMAAAVSAPIAAVMFGRLELTVLFVALALIVLWKHRANIGRLRRGEEPRVGKSV
jgi:acyl phosphate:glycerol-3-phosphate acyltransferase